ncbi:hypothetical protein IWX50DRAFT_23947 [Phyllosticta citricarpa]|uniref:Uncharacterized protein n=1 Tax=Phyllosticta citricarpa TaxID=55181 RepID=A0ABR1LJW6_9PEZI
MGRPWETCVEMQFKGTKAGAKIVGDARRKGAAVVSNDSAAHDVEIRQIWGSAQKTRFVMRQKRRARSEEPIKLLQDIKTTQKNAEKKKKKKNNSRSGTKHSVMGYCLIILSAIGCWACLGRHDRVILRHFVGTALGSIVGVEPAFSGSILFHPDDGN